MRRGALAVAVIVFSVCVAVTTAAQECPVELSTGAMPLDAEIGVPFMLTVTIKNTCDQSILVLVREANFVVDVADGHTTTTVEVPRYTRERGAFKDDEVALRVGASYSFVLPVQINDLHATLGEGWIGPPGRYSLRVRYNSERSTQPRSEWCWKGTATSQFVEVSILPIAESTAAKYREQLEECSREPETDTTEVANFYRAYRDQAAAEQLMQLLERDPAKLWLVDAIVFQRRLSDAARLRALSVRMDDLPTRSILAEAAAKLR